MTDEKVAIQERREGKGETSTARIAKKGQEYMKMTCVGVSRGEGRLAEVISRM